MTLVNGKYLKLTGSTSGNVAAAAVSTPVQSPYKPPRYHLSLEYVVEECEVERAQCHVNQELILIRGI